MVIVKWLTEHIGNLSFYPEVFNTVVVGESIRDVKIKLTVVYET